MDQNEDVLGTDQPAQALIGKCVKIKVTSTHKWHISGKIVDASPKPIEAEPDHFEKLALERKRKQEIESRQSIELDAEAN